MALRENTMFEVTVSNSVRNQTQNVAGIFGAFSGETFTPDDVSAGMLCVPSALTPNSGYESEGILNGNTWAFIAAEDGTAGRRGDHTGIYAVNSYDVNKVGSGSVIFNAGSKTLGLSVPAGVRTDFTEIIVGEKYTFKAGSFASARTTENYFTIANGLLVPSASKPLGAGLYFVLDRLRYVTEGALLSDMGYVLTAAWSSNSVNVNAVGATVTGDLNFVGDEAVFSISANEGFFLPQNAVTVTGASGNYYPADGKLYISGVTGAITISVNAIQIPVGEWMFNSTIADFSSETAIEIGFTSNGYSCTAMKTKTSPYTSHKVLCYVVDSGDNETYDYTANEWLDDSFRSITISTPSTSDTLNLYIAQNATKQE